MAEVRTLVDGKSLSYEGVFDIRDLYKIIDSWFRDRGYDKQEIKNWEDVSESEKQVVLEIVPYKKVSDYARIDIRIFMIFSRLSEIDIERDGIRHKLNKGRAEFYFDAYLVTDYENKWETRPIYFFIKNVLDKFVYRVYTSSYDAEAIRDCTEIENE
ncbi:MAG TPA: hypothetical protein V6C58_02090, partial [Allocoleopsis sp.]